MTRPPSVGDSYQVTGGPYKGASATLFSAEPDNSLMCRWFCGGPLWAVYIVGLNTGYKWMPEKFLRFATTWDELQRQDTFARWASKVDLLESHLDLLKKQVDSLQALRKRLDDLYSTVNFVHAQAVDLQPRIVALEAAAAEKRKKL